MTPQNQPTQQGQQQQQQQSRIDEEYPYPDRGHGCEVRRPLELEDLLPPAQAFFPGTHTYSVEG